MHCRNSPVDTASWCGSGVGPARHLERKKWTHFAKIVSILFEELTLPIRIERTQILRLDMAEQNQDFPEGLILRALRHAAQRVSLSEPRCEIRAGLVKHSSG